MNEVGKVFLCTNAGKSSKGPTKEANQPILPPEDSAALDSASDEWLDSCLRDFLERKRCFEVRYRSKGEWIGRMVAYTFIFIAILWVSWPVWNVFSSLVSIESSEELNTYYSTLGVGSTASAQEIKKAYRQAVKQWHPDLNPQCGDLCKDEMMRIQKAHDVLLSRGDQRYVLANIEEKRASELRSLILFRMFQMASGSAKQITLALSILCNLGGEERKLIGLIVGVFTFLVFTATEAKKFGVNWIVLAQIAFHVISLVKPNAEKIMEEAAVKAAYVNLLWETILTLIPTCLFHVIAGVINPSGNIGDQILGMVFSSLYVLGFLYRFMPNLYDNFVMRKCSISLPYITEKGGMAPTKFIFTELGFLLDDLYAHTSGVSDFARAIVYVVHFVYLCQLFTLPWDAPVNWRRMKKENRKPVEKNQSRTAETVESKATKQTSNSVPLSDTSTGMQRTRIRSPPPQRKQQEQDLSEEEFGMFLNLDQDPVLWLDVPYLKYSMYAPKNTLKGKECEEVMHLRPTADLQRILLFAVPKTPKEGSIPKLIRGVVDPVMSKLIAIEQGPGVVALQKGSQVHPISVQTYKALLGDLCANTQSTLWRSRFDLRRSSYPIVSMRSAKQVLQLIGVSIFVLAFVSYATPSLINILRSTMDLPMGQRPLVHSRFAAQISKSHIMNALNAGLLSRKGIVVFTPDFWDSIQHARNTSV